MSDQLVAEAAIHTTIEYTKRLSMTSTGFKISIPESKRLQINVLDIADTGIGAQSFISVFRLLHSQPEKVQ
jgi:hypothetical protein